MKCKPNLPSHFLNLDRVQHAHGAASPQTVASLDQMDGYVGDLLAAIKAERLKSTTDVFVVSDHEFSSFDLVVIPNVVLAKEIYMLGTNSPHR